MGKSSYRVYYRTTGGLYWKVFTDFSPAFKIDGKKGKSSRETHFTLREKDLLSPLIGILSSDLFWWWYTVTSNCRDLNPSDINNFPIPESAIRDSKLSKLGRSYLDDIQCKSVMLRRVQKKTGVTETQSFIINKSKPIIEKIDKAMRKHYGLDDMELDFIMNYDINYRIGVEE